MWLPNDGSNAPKIPLGKGTRLIVLHAGTRSEGLIDDCDLVFLAKSKDGDTGTCFIQKIYAPSSSLLQGKYLPLSPSPLRLNIFRLLVILSLTQLYRYTLEIFLFSTTTFKYKYRPTPSDEVDKNIQRKSHFLFFSH